MKITKSTKWIDFEPFITPERLAQLRETVTDCAFFDFWQLTIGDFSIMLSNGFPEDLQNQMNNIKITVFEVIKIMNATDKFMKEFSSVMLSYDMQLKPEEMQASSYCPEFSPIENMLNFCLDEFGPHPTKGGFNEEITLLEYNIRKKKRYSDSMYQRALNDIQLRKSK